MIGNNHLIGDIQKLQYLLDYLHGETKEAAAHLQLSSINCQSALLILEERFADNRQAVNEYLNAIIDVKRMSENTLRNSLAGLAQVVVQIVMRKMDSETVRLFEEFIQSSQMLPFADKFVNSF